MNRKYDQTDSERDQSGRLERDEAAKRRERQDKPVPGRQQPDDEQRRRDDDDSGGRVADEP